MSRARCLLLVVFSVATCTSAGERPADLTAPAEPLVWPAPPAPARIQYLYSFRAPEHLGIRPSVLERVWEVVAGEENREMVKPYAIAVEGERLAVADPGLAVVHVYDPASGKYERIAKAGGTSLRSPVGVAFGVNRTYVADSALGQVFAFDATGERVLTMGDIERPTGLAFDREGGRLYVADTLGHRILVFDSAGKRLLAFGQRGAEPGAFNYPTHLFLRAGRLYVNDTMNFRVQVFDLVGNHLATFGRHGDGSGDFAQPKGLAVDREGHVYVADALFDRVQIFDSDGNYLLGFGGTGVKAGDFWLPAGLFITDGRIYVADSYNRRVQVFQFLGGG